MSEQYGISPRSAAATLAAMSPQKDWFQNVDLAKRVLDIRQQQGNMSATPEMGPIMDRFVAMQKKPAAAEALQSAVDNIQSGIPLAQIRDPFEQAVWIRAYDEAHNPRSYQVVTPEGDFAGPALNKDGSEQAVAWGSFNPIEKAMQVLKDDSTENISRQMGGNHKVRNFYNNIISPNSPNGDVTIDTHAIAAGHMRPLGGNDPIVEAGLGMSPASSAAATGSRGLYGLYAEAYRRAAAQAGILPRQMQSITWEGVRGLFSPEQKRNANLVQSVNQVWDQYRGGQIDAPTARATITELAGGINAPEWTGRSP
jgi:hypothetical protein